jgi:hypothetical protein
MPQGSRSPSTNLASFARLQSTFASTVSLIASLYSVTSSW